MKIVTLGMFIVLAAGAGLAQCEGMPGMHPAQPPQPQAKKADSKPAPKDEHAGMQHEDAAVEKLGSGTMPRPGSSPEYMWMTRAGSWDIMAHGQLFLTYNQQGGPRGVGKFESSNWLMLMEQHKLGKGTLLFREMLSAEPLTFPHGGSPQLFQTGETYHGQALVDHQHPHDVFGELSVTYTVPLNENVAWQFYGAPVGEPALGPVSFMHRASGSEDPAAPLGHHLQDSTHISAGVVTTGFIVEKKFKIEGSLFNGREPDENRATIDFAPMSSWSVRASFQPTSDWSMQYSFGRLVQPEALELTDIDRQTASVTYNRPLAEGNWATTLLWGRNHKLAEDTVQNSYLLESTVNFQQKNYAYTRLELVDKDELFPTLPPPAPSFRIGAYTFGGVRDLVHNAKAQIGLGADVTFYSKAAALDPVYGDTPVSFRIFLRFRPGQMQH
ncbi:MAG TPA: hypothetical protein VL382_11990 [Terriglobales bacterium]|nr:hypothetical protein [Terriglobales bacterium]